MNLSAWAIRNPVPPIALFLVLSIVGLFSFLELPVTRFPNVDVPVVSVTVVQPGAAPRELVSGVTQPLEDALAEINGVHRITSSISMSSSVTTIEFEMEVLPDRAVSDVTGAVTQLRGTLPQDIVEPVVSRVDFTDLPILTYAIADPAKSIENLSEFVDDVVVRRLQSEQSIGHVSRQGGADRVINVTLRPDLMAALGITAAEISAQLRATNVDLGAGRGELNGREFSIRALGGSATVDDLAALPLALPGERTIRLDEAGRVRDGHGEIRNFAMLNRQSVVAFSVFRATGYSDVAAAQDAKTVLDTLKSDYPGITLSQIEDASIYTLGSYDSAVETLIEGALLAVIVVLIFLRNWRATLITALALPLSIVPTFIVMQWLGFSLNTVSLLGITLVTGILVDDAIVEIENIVRHIRTGKSAYDAAREAAVEIGTTVIAISLTIVAVFVPVSFMSGLAGQYFRQFGLTVAVAVLFSLLVARIITPMLAAYFLKGDAEDEAVQDGALMRRYISVLSWTLHHRTVTLVAGLAIFAGSLFSATLLPSTLVPSADQGRTNLSVLLPPGTTLNQTFAVSRTIADRLLDLTEIENVYVQSGIEGVNSADFAVYLVDKKDRTKSTSQVEAEIPALLADIPDIRMTVLGPENKQDLSVSVLGDSPEAAADAALDLAHQMRQLDVVRDITTSAALPQPEIRITPRPEMAARMGVTTTDLATTISVATLGDIDANLAKFTADGRQIPVIVRLDAVARDNLDLLATQPVPTTNGTPVPLGAVAEISLGQGPSTLTRQNRRALVTVSADLAGGAVLKPALAAIDALPIARKMPEGTQLESAGDAEVMAQLFSSFALAMGVGLLLVYMVLVLLFGSFITPATIILSLPLSAGGAILALYITGNAISLPVLIGFLMLMGIVTKNAIMLVEFAIESIKAGSDTTAAALDAAHKRARPIVMTTIAMVAGMIPSALALGAGGEFRAPMAIAVIGGLLVSTLLSLLFVPSLFSAIDGMRHWLVKNLSRLTGIGAHLPESASAVEN